MFQSAATIERARDITSGSTESTIFQSTADRSQPDDDLIDGWLSSLGEREFELILNALADDDTRSLFALDPTA